MMSGEKKTAFRTQVIRSLLHMNGDEGNCNVKLRGLNLE